MNFSYGMFFLFQFMSFQAYSPLSHKVECKYSDFIEEPTRSFIFVAPPAKVVSHQFIRNIDHNLAGVWRKTRIMFGYLSTYPFLTFGN